MSRDHRSLHSAVTLLANHGIAIDPTRAPQHRRSDTDLRAAIELAAELNDLGGVHAVLVHREPNGPCTWCQLDGHHATVTVYGDPDPRDTEHPIDMEHTCHTCAPKAVQQARIEQRHDAHTDIKVEIGVCPR